MCSAALQSVIRPLIVPFLDLQQSGAGEVLEKATWPMARWSLLMTMNFNLPRLAIACQELLPFHFELGQIVICS